MQPVIPSIIPSGGNIPTDKNKVFNRFLQDQTGILKERCREIRGAKSSIVKCNRKIEGLKNAITKVRNFQTELTQRNSKLAKAKIILRKIVLIALPIAVLLIAFAILMGGTAGGVVIARQRLDNVYKYLKVGQFFFSLIVLLESIGSSIILFTVAIGLIEMAFNRFCNISIGEINCEERRCPRRRRDYIPYNFNLRSGCDYCHGYEINEDLAVFDPNYLEGEVIQGLKEEKRAKKGIIAQNQTIIGRNLQDIRDQERNFMEKCSNKCGVQITSVSFKNVPERTSQTGPGYTRL